MPSYKLTYYDMRGRAELIRMLLTLADQKFEDKRITREQWATMKRGELIYDSYFCSVDLCVIKNCDWTLCRLDNNTVKASI